MPLIKNPVFFVIGATGSGKSKVAIEVAHELREKYDYREVVVVNCDVYQCFNALPVCTNKPSIAELEGVPHVFLSFLNSDGSLCAPRSEATTEELLAFDEAAKVLQRGVSFNVHAYKSMVTSFISAYLSGRPDAAVIICGGTCYYAEALLFSSFLVNDGSSEESDVDDGESARDKEGLWERLNEVDTEIASRYHPNDTRRLQRLLQIYEKTGQKPSTIYETHEPKLSFDHGALFIVWTRMERARMDDVVNSRVDDMIRRGMVHEAQSFWLSHKGQFPHTSLHDAIGCKEFMDYFAEHPALEISGNDLLEVAEKIKGDTRRYARQQERWIKNRLLRQLQRTPLKDMPSHFLALNTDRADQLMSSLRNGLAVFLKNSATSEECGLSFPLADGKEPPKPVSQEKCTICDLLVYGRGQMEVHLKSKRHRGALRRLALEQEQRERYGRELPPQKKRRCG